MTVHLVKGRYVNSYIIEQGDKLCVIDVAWRGEKYVMGYITQTLGRCLQDVKLVICTHGDPDHCGGVQTLAKHCDAQVAYPYATHSFLLKSLNDPTGVFFRFVTSFIESFRPRMWLMYANTNRDIKAKALPNYSPSKSEVEESIENESESSGNGIIDYRLKNRSEIPGFSGWKVVHTPGHSWDSCSFYCAATGALISGDTLLGSKKKGHVVIPSIYSNPVQTQRTLRRLQKLNPTTIYPGHGHPISGEGLVDHLVKKQN